MSNDGQNFEYPVNPSDDTQPQPAVNVADDVVGQQSRRKFLRTAVISGVAVATVGTTAGVAAAAANPHPGVLKRLGINLGTVSGQASCNLCFESSMFATIADNTFTYNHKSGSTTPGTFYFVFRAGNLAPGSYTISISPDFLHTAANPFEYQAKSNNVKLYQKAANTAFNCPVALPSDSVKPDVITDTFPISRTITGSNADLWVFAHFSFDGTLTTGNHDYAFTITLSGDASCSQPITLHAVQSDV